MHSRVWLLPQEASEAGMQSQVAQLQQQRTQQSEQLSSTEQECSRLQQVLNAQAQVLLSTLAQGSGPGLLTSITSAHFPGLCSQQEDPVILAKTDNNLSTLIGGSGWLSKSRGLHGMPHPQGRPYRASHVHTPRTQLEVATAEPCHRHD